MISVRTRKKKLTKMLRKNINFLTRKVFIHKNLVVRRSALFINGPKASKTFVFVTPHNDLPELMKQKDLVQEQLIKRQANFDLDKLENLWIVYEELKKQKADYDKKKAEISHELGKLIKSDPDSDVTKKLKLHSDLIKENIKKLKVPLWSAEEAVMVECLKLPNVVHHRTPIKNNQIIHTQGSPPNNDKEHLRIGKKDNLINFRKKENYYLTGDAAIFELGAKFYFHHILRKNNFTQFSNPDFVKSVIVEGCGEDHTNPDATFILHHNEDSNVHPDGRLHLTGGASLHAFLAYHAKNVLNAKSLPLNYFSMGRQYVPSQKEDSLLHASQASAVQVFNANVDATALDASLDKIIEMLKDAYSKFGYHYRISIVAADKLSMWESLRVVVEMYSSSLKTYVSVAEISASGDFISKRLMFTYLDNKKQSKFPHIISGTILNVPKLLACVLEQDSDFAVPEFIKVENWSMTH